MREGTMATRVTAITSCILKEIMTVVMGSTTYFSYCSSDGRHDAFSGGTSKTDGFVELGHCVNLQLDK
jgi:hypothetical protein